MGPVSDTLPWQLQCSDSRPWREVLVFEYLRNLVVKESAKINRLKRYLFLSFPVDQLAIDFFAIGVRNRQLVCSGNQGFQRYCQGFRYFPGSILNGD